MSRTSTDEPHVRCLRVAVDDEVLVGCVFVLADSRFEKRGVCELGHTDAQLFAHDLNERGGRRAVAVGRVERLSPGVVANLNAAPLVARYPVDGSLAESYPDRKVPLVDTLTPRRRPEEVNLLSGRADQVAYHVGEDFPQPRTTGEDESVSVYGRTVVEANCLHPFALDSSSSSTLVTPKGG